MTIPARVRKLLLQLTVLTLGLATPASAETFSDGTSPDLFGAVLSVPIVGIHSEWAVATAPSRPSPRLAGDHSIGRAIEVGGSSNLGYEYVERFNRADSLDDPAIEGNLRLSLDPAAQALVAQGPESGRQHVTLTYHFTSPFRLGELVSELEGEIQGSEADAVQLRLSPDGREYGFAPHAYGRPNGNAFRLTTVGSSRFDDRCGFWVRIAAELGPKSRVAVRGFRTAGRVKPPGRPQVALEPQEDGLAVYRETFQSTRLLHLAEIENGSALEWNTGRMLIRGHESGPVRVALRQRFITPVPLRAVVVRVRNAADPREGGAANVMGLSLDGRSLVARAATPAAGGLFEGETEVRLDDPARLADARQFFLHIELSNRAGASGIPSNWVSAIEVQARTAGTDPVPRLSALDTAPDRP